VPAGDELMDVSEVAAVHGDRLHDELAERLDLVGPAAAESGSDRARTADGRVKGGAILGQVTELPVAEGRIPRDTTSRTMPTAASIATLPRMKYITLRELRGFETANSSGS
jgi:hypothetical protein